MRNTLISIFAAVMSFSPTFANPSLFEEKWKKAWEEQCVFVEVPAEVPVPEAEPAIFIITEPSKRDTFTELSVCFEEAVGYRKMVICKRPELLEWAR